MPLDQAINRRIKIYEKLVYFELYTLVGQKNKNLQTRYFDFFYTYSNIGNYTKTFEFVGKITVFA